MLHHKDQTFRQGVLFSAPGASPTTHSLRIGGGPNCRERLPIWLPELLVQVRRRQPRDRISQQVSFGLAAAMAVPHRNSACSGGVTFAGYEGAAPSTIRIQKISRAPKLTSLS
jgi:hypothetical protein